LEQNKLVDNININNQSTINISNSNMDKNKQNVNKIAIKENKNIIKNILNSLVPITSAQAKKRNFGIDIARILAIILIINHHILFHGGPRSGTKKFSYDNNLLLYFNTIFCSGVNIFGMISGFVGFRSHNYANLIYLLIQTSLYNYGIAYYYKKIKPHWVPDLDFYLYPLFICDYWYFTAYFIIYFFLPLINAGIKGMDKRKMGIFNLFIFLFFSCFNQIIHYSKRLNRDIFSFGNGLSHFWLLLLYFYGGYFGRFYDESRNCNKLIIFLLCIAIIILAAYLRNLVLFSQDKYNHHEFGMSYEYTSPSQVIIAICFIIMLSKLNIKYIFIQKIISLFAPLTYGIYLIHNHKIVREKVISGNYSWLLKYHSFKIITMELIESLKIFIYCSFIDYIRFLLFKLFRIRQICLLISYLIDKISNGILFIFEFIY
jgi:surface polysaccharide O-acyltransferase-like enzyme